MSTVGDLVKMSSKVNGVMETIDTNSELIQRLSTQTYRKNSAELDNIVFKIQNLLQKIRNKEIQNYSDEYVELQCMSIPAILYDVVDAVEDLGCKQDLSKLYYDEIYAQVYGDVIGGTIPDKEAEAKTASIAEKITLEIYKRAYNKLKKKFDVAMELHSSLKKVLDHRIKKKEIFRRDNCNANMGEEIDEHEQPNK